MIKTTDSTLISQKKRLKNVTDMVFIIIINANMCKHCVTEIKMRSVIKKGKK